MIFSSKKFVNGLDKKPFFLYKIKIITLFIIVFFNENIVFDLLYELNILLI